MKIGNLNILIGADPEKFVSNGVEFISAHGLIEGTKKEPFIVENGAVQVDGMALEFNIDPADNEEEFVNNLQSVMSQLDAMVPNYMTHSTPVAEFSGEVIKGSPKEALELGCEPDFNAWEGGAANPTPDGDTNFRTGAGHIHIGWTNGAKSNDPAHVAACINIAKQLDLYLGVPSVLYDGDARRRELYGKAGAFRVKPYGVEYRVLSNVWLRDESLMRWVYSNTVKALSTLMGGGDKAKSDVVDIINNSDTNKAREYCSLNNIQLPAGVM